MLSGLTLKRPAVMGILNVTPDSFSDGGVFDGRASAMRQVERMQNDGADIIDVGGESTRPGAAAVDETTELARVIPIIQAIRERSDIPISVDTSKPGVMREAVLAGASMINDVLALGEDGAIETVAQLDVPVCLMHMQGRPRTMQDAPSYDDVVTEVTDFLGQRMAECLRAGISRDRIAVDPGFGFGKRHSDNLTLLAQLDALGNLGVPILVGLSRKSTLGEITGRRVDGRLAASLAAAIVAVQNGAGIVRVHDVRETVDALAVIAAVDGCRNLDEGARS